MNSRPFRQFSVLSIIVSAVLAVAPAAHATYPGANGRLAFVRANQIYTAQPDGGGLVKLTTGGKNYRPKWSPDGRRIAYVHEVSATSRDLWVMNADGSGKSRVTRLGSVTGPTWSPDGQRLAFGGLGPCEVGGPARCRLDLQTVRSTAPYGMPTVLLGNYTGSDELVGDVIGPPAWSPDGRVITFGSHNFPQSPDRYIVSYAVASRLVTMVDMVGGGCCGEGLLSNPQYGPDSARLTVTSTRYCPQCGESEPAPTTYAELGPAVPTRAHDSDAAFSPDGRRSVVTNDAGGAAYLYTQALSGGARTRVTAGYQPDWQSRH
jgi:Tol biopolymer transport system component